MQKLWIFSELFYPEQTSTAYILTEVSKKMANRYAVEVVCPYPAYDGKMEDLKNELPGIKITRLKIFRGNKNNNILRIFRFIAVSLLFIYFLVFRVKSGEKVLVVTNPAPFLVGAAFIRKFKKIEMSLLVHDIFPENTLAANYIKSESSLAYRFSKLIFDASYRKYDKIIVLGRDMRTVVERKLRRISLNNKVSIIENWADIENIYPSQWISDKIVFLFAGNFGALQGIQQLFEIIKKINNKVLQFHFIGDGKMKTWMEQEKAQSNLECVSIQPPFKRNEQNSVLNACDIGIVSLSAGMYGLGVPSKTYNIMAAGKPIFYIGDPFSEVDLMIKDYKNGFTFDIGEPEKIISFLNSLTLDDKESLKKMGMVSREIAVKKYSEEAILQKFSETL